MHIVNWTVAGLVVLAIFVLAGMLMNRLRGTKVVDGAALFIGPWLFAALYNFYDGWMSHGIPFVNEVAAFVPIFGIPAAAAWYWSRRSRA